ncbi:MAG TPA: hypothetical protein VFU98_16575 [Microlunatus sp.]|nr:hypothetical protein [Microlunatus sp.]
MSVISLSSPTVEVIAVLADAIENLSRHSPQSAVEGEGASEIGGDEADGIDAWGSLSAR